MLKKEINYISHSGEKVQDIRYFHLSKSDLLEMEMTTTGGLVERLTAMINAKNTGELLRLFKDLVLRSYGERTPDGKFLKYKEDENGNLRKLSNDFFQTEAYDALFFELVTNDKSMADFVNGIMPEDLRPSEVDLAKAKTQFAQLTESSTNA